jgi:hypothetical protein
MLYKLLSYIITLCSKNKIHHMALQYHEFFDPYHSRSVCSITVLPERLHFHSCANKKEKKPHFHQVQNLNHSFGWLIVRIHLSYKAAIAVV